MFGNMFDEDSGGVICSMQVGNTVPLPPAPRNRSGLAGIRNQGSTCFLNTALQVMAYTPEFRDDFFRLSQRELGKLEERENNKVKQIPLQIQRLFAKLMLEKQEAVSSKDVTDSFGWTSDEVSTQHDAQELYQLLLDAISQSLHATSGASLIKQHFHGILVNKTECKRCGNFSEKEVEYSDLFVPVEGFSKGLQESLHNNYCVPEMLTGINQYKCDVCDAHVDAARTTKLRSLPPVLKMSLLRFSYNNDTGRRYKVTDRFPFPHELDMSEYTESGRSVEDHQYELYAVIIHGGSADGGHYTACIRDIDNLGQWEYPAVNPTKVVADLKAENSDFAECQSPQELVRLILSKQAGRSLSMNELSAEILKTTGVAWGKSYKRRHGGFPKFIRNHPHLFHSMDNTVSLVEKPTSNPGSGESTETDDVTEEASREDVNINCSINSDSNGVQDMVNGFSGRPESPSLPGQRWFYFDDSRVCPMRAKDLKHEFAGKRSAYLLFYRRKGLCRPPAADGDPSYGIPYYLLEDVDKMNLILEKERKEYAEKKAEEERRAKEVTVEIRFSWSQKVESGVLKMQEEPIQLTCARSDTLDQLFTKITAECGGDTLGPDFHVHRMKCWDNKTHLYDELKDKEKSLTELEVENGTILFLWDGQQVDGQNIPSGVESEPLTIVLKQYQSSLEITHNFPKNMGLEQFRSQVSILTGIPENTLQMQFPDIEMMSQHNAEMSSGRETLESIHLKDGASVLFDSSDSSPFTTDSNETSSMTPDTVDSSYTEDQSDSQFCVVIENRCNKDKQSWNTLELEVDKEMSMGQVKQLFMATYNIDYQSAVLRENDSIKGLQDPYDEEASVASAGITSNTLLVLDTLQIPLTFKLRPEPSPNSPVMQVTVDKGCTVEGCLHIMAEAAGLSDVSEWHLRTTNFFGDLDKILDDLTQPLSSCGVDSGSFLILEQGCLIPKGSISLSVLLFASPNQLAGCPLPSITEAFDGLWITTSKTKVATEKEKYRHLGDVVMSKTATLEELRNQVKELLESQTCLQAKTKQLRISLVEGKHKQLRKVLRGLQSTLQHLKVTGDKPIGVQIVDHAAEPSDKEVVLNLMVRNSADRSYNQPQELLWDTSRGTTAASLRLSIACRLMVPEDTITIAKHFPDEFQWKVLTDNIPKDQGSAHNHHHNNNRRGKKRSHARAAKPNITLKPFHVQDGDVIGIKNMHSHLPILLDQAIPTPGPEDFSTEEDDDGRLQQLEEQRQKQLQRQAKRLVDGLSGPGMRRPEVPLRIRVGDFS